MGSEGGLAITSERTPLQTVKWMGRERESSYLTSEETATSFTTVYTYNTRLAANALVSHLVSHLMEMYCTLLDRTIQELWYWRC